MKIDISLDQWVECEGGCTPSPAEVLFAERTGITVTQSHVLSDIKFQCLLDAVRP